MIFFDIKNAGLFHIEYEYVQQRLGLIWFVMDVYAITERICVTYLQKSLGAS